MNKWTAVYFVSSEQSTFFFTIHILCSYKRFKRNVAIALQVPLFPQDVVCRPLSVVVCHSVTRVHCDKTAKARIMQFSL